MDIYYSAKTVYKIIRWQVRRAYASFRWGREKLARSPAVVGNAIPKSGSHLINQVLLGLPDIGPFANPGFPPLTRSEDNRRLPAEKVLANLRRMRSGDIAYGYVHAEEPFVSVLSGPGRATIFVYRDPRDMVISHVFYATQIQVTHGMHHYYTKVLNTIEERINAAIEGVKLPGNELAGVRERYAGYLDWLEQASVLSLRFEDLILERETALGRLLDYLGERGLQLEMPRAKAISLLKASIIPGRSGTYRRGQPGNWREYFTPANVALFKEKANDLLIRLGYERNTHW